MKKVYFFLIMAVTSLGAFSQDPSSTQKVEQYCELTGHKKLLSNKVSIDVEFGEKRKLFDTKDYRIKDEATDKVKQFNSLVDALNYMGKIGWKLVNAFPITEGSTNVYHFFFKREVELSSLQEETK